MKYYLSWLIITIKYNYRLQLKENADYQNTEKSTKI